MTKITSLRAMEILDSRGNPTLQVEVAADNFKAQAAVPSGASTGTHEAVELRDRDSHRYSGKGVLTAVSNVEQKIAPKLIGMEITAQKDIDQTLLSIDCTTDKSSLGANAILGVSLACARAAALAAGQSLVDYLRATYSFSATASFPTPTFNVINGGAHADSGLNVQEFMLVPSGIKDFREQLRAGSEIFHTLKKNLAAQGLRVAVGDEGGFAPALSDSAAAFELLMTAIADAGYRPGQDIFLAVDAAASEFYADGNYNFEKQTLSAAEMIAIYQTWVEKYPIISLEDGLAEDDWENWSALTVALGEKIITVGDDLYTTNPQRLERGITAKASNGILIKPNQIGTLTETMACVQMAREHNLKIIISHRSGETTDAFIADLAVAVGADFIKSGAPNRSERLAKYNRLLEIEVGW